LDGIAMRFLIDIHRRINLFIRTVDMPKATLERRKFIEKRLPVDGRRILEIGALTTPTYTPEDACVKYMDWFSRQELIDLYRKDPKLDVKDVIDVDYVIKEPRFSTFIEEKFDLIICNHVIEHIPDVITWVQQLQQILSEEGAVFLSVPDKKYTFDYLRRETSLVEILRCFHEKLERSNYYQILDSIYFHRPITPSDNYFEKRRKLKKKPRSISEAMKEADSAQGFHSGGFHCHVFSHRLFPNLWSDLIESGLINLEIAEISRVKRGLGEFHILLRPQSKKSPKQRRP
jgi:SAM-dependent methyltransferase